MQKTLLTLLFMGCAFGQTKSATPAKSTGAAKSTAPAKAAPAAPASNRAKLLNPAALNAPAPAEFDVKFTTTKGDVTFHVVKAWSPHGADRFYNLVRNGFFTDAAFFRVIAGFMAQFGINADPTISRAWMQANIPDDRPKESNKRGRLTFAQAGAPNTRGTQLFINFKDNTFLDDKFAPIGEVTEGMSVVDALYSGYGEGAPGGAGPEQGQVQAEGKEYLDKKFPKLDKIISAKVVTPAAAPAAAAPKAAPKAETTKK